MVSPCTQNRLRARWIPSSTYFLLIFPPLVSVTTAAPCAHCRAAPLSSCCLPVASRTLALSHSRTLLSAGRPVACRLVGLWPLAVSSSPRRRLSSCGPVAVGGILLAPPSPCLPVCLPVFLSTSVCLCRCRVSLVPLVVRSLVALPVWCPHGVVDPVAALDLSIRLFNERSMNGVIVH
jgi:hypothetical protein